MSQYLDLSTLISSPLNTTVSVSIGSGGSREVHHTPCRVMSQFSPEDEAELQSLLRQLLKSVKERISGAPSVECAEEILLHLEETDKNFHK